MFTRFTLLILDAFPKMFPSTYALILFTFFACFERYLVVSKDTEFGFRLPGTVIPLHYDVMLNPHLLENSSTFTGETNITITVNEPTYHIVLHSHGLVYTKVQLYSEITTFITSYEILDDSRQYLIVKTGPQAMVQAGNYSLHFEFYGLLTDKIVGFYKTSSGESVMAASKFQPTYARQAFPCFDEPAMKATYKVSLVKPSSYIALSNMNQISIDPNVSDGNDLVHFAPSVPMSTYLPCFVVCDYTFREETIETNNIGAPFTLRTYARNTDKISYALDIGKRSTEFYIQYYQVPFPLPKLDMIAIPDYVSGATEHWGLITFRETAFLIDETTSSVFNKISVANTIAHELAHMWFGNLVTMKWWDEVWLNEGFATYMQVKALNYIEPSWTMLDQFLMKTLHPVLNSDAKLSSHPIVQNVTSPDEITAIFDVISYNKGSSVLRMLEGFIGEGNFQNAITAYLNLHAYGSTETQDLLNALEPYFLAGNPGLNLRYIMDTWTVQSGYPLVTVSHGPDAYSVVLTQTRFLADPSAQSPQDSPFNYRWFIPITYKTFQGDHEQTVWFPDTADNITIQLQDNSFWLKLNNDQVGYYRVNYPRDIWLKLLDQLQMQTSKLTISDRAQLINDAFGLAEARVNSYEMALQMSTYLSHEREYVPWVVASGALFTVRERLRNTTGFQLAQEYIQSLVLPLYQNMSWERQNDTTIIQSLLRVQILGVAVGSGVEEALGQARHLFLSWLNSHGTAQPAEIEPDIRHFVYYHGMKTATAEDWNKLWSVYLGEEDAQQRDILMGSLAAVESTELLTRYLELAGDEANVRTQDYLNVLESIAVNPHGTDLVWNYVRQHWTRLVERFTLNSRYLGALVPSVASAFNTEERLREMEEFFSANPEAGAGATARRRALETVRNNIEWSQHNQQTVIDWLTNHLPNRTKP